jgi:aspartyl-tRNA synthetase
MTDELTDAVRRLKELQADVERLKAGDDQRGVPRLLFSQSETAVGRDRPDTRSRDVLDAETAVGRDAQADIRNQRTVEDGFYNAAGYNVATYE